MGVGVGIGKWAGEGMQGLMGVRINATRCVC